MELQQLEIIRKKCKLSVMQMARYNQMIQNQHHYPSGMTINQMRLPTAKIDNLVAEGYLKKQGFCYTDNFKHREDLFILTNQNT